MSDTTPEDVASPAEGQVEGESRLDPVALLRNSAESVIGFLESLDTDPAVIAFIRQCEPMEAVALASAIHNAHHELSNRALQAYARAFFQDRVAEEGIPELSAQIATEASLWWSIQDPTSPPTLMIKCEEHPVWTPLYQFDVVMIPTEELSNYPGEVVFTPDQLLRYSQQYGPVTPTIFTRVLIQPPTKH